MNVPARKLLTAREVAEILRLSETTIYEYAREQKIPAFKFGGTWRFPARELWESPRRRSGGKGEGTEGANSHAAWRMVFTNVGEVVEIEGRLRAFIADAIEIEKAGLKVEVERSPEPVPG